MNLFEKHEAKKSLVLALAGQFIDYYRTPPRLGVPEVWYYQTYLKPLNREVIKFPFLIFSDQ